MERNTGWRRDGLGRYFVSPLPIGKSSSLPMCSQVADELSTFPGEKPKWKGVEKSTYMSPLVGETANNLQADTVDIPSSTPKASNACRSLPGLQDFRRHVAETYIQRPSSVQAPKMPSMDIPRKY